MNERIYDKPLPCDLPTEEMVLGALMEFNQPDFPEISEIVGPQDFCTERHNRIFQNMAKVVSAGEILDKLTVFRQLHANHMDQTVGGFTYLMKITDMMPRVVNLKSYAQRIRDMAERRRIIFACESLSNRAWEAVDDPAELQADAITQLREICEPRKTQLRMLGQIIADEGGMDRFTEESVGIGSPWPRLDHDTTGLKPGELTVVAGLTASGKTSLLHQMADHAADRSNAQVVIFSLEMSGREVGSRLASGRSGVSRWQMSHGATSEQRRRFAAACGEIDKLGIRIEDRSICSVEAIQTALRKVERANRPLLVIVDYLQIMKTSNKENRAQAVSELSRGLKMIAREFDCSVLVASQFKRGTQDREPNLEDLKESSGIEQDADRVMLIHRKNKAYVQDKPIPVRLLIAKQRNGPSGCYVDMQFIPRLARFYETLPESEQRSFNAD